MIIASDGVLKIDGNKREVLAETLRLLHGIYETLVEKEGEEAADEQFHEMFRIATMSKEEVKEAAAELRAVDTESELLGEEPSRMLS